MVAHADPAPQIDRREKFLQLLPKIRSRVEFAFRSLPRQTREDLAEEAIVDSFVAFMRLAELGKLHVALPTPLADYAVKRTLAGRRVGAKLNVHDLTSPYAQKVNGVRVARLDHYDRQEHAWKEIVIEDKSAGPAEVAITKIDFETWIGRLPRRARKIVERLLLGDRTFELARRFRVTAGRISQLRRALRESWHEFQGEAVEPLPAAA